MEPQELEAFLAPQYQKGEILAPNKRPLYFEAYNQNPCVHPRQVLALSLYQKTANSLISGYNYQFNWPVAGPLAKHFSVDRAVGNLEELRDAGYLLNIDLHDQVPTQFNDPLAYEAIQRFAQLSGETSKSVGFYPFQSGLLAIIELLKIGNTTGVLQFSSGSINPSNNDGKDISPGEHIASMTIEDYYDLLFLALRFSQGLNPASIPRFGINTPYSIGCTQSKRGAEYPFYVDPFSEKAEFTAGGEVIYTKRTREPSIVSVIPTTRTAVAWNPPLERFNAGASNRAIAELKEHRGLSLKEQRETQTVKKYHEKIRHVYDFLALILHFTGGMLPQGFNINAGDLVFNPWEPGMTLITARGGLRKVDPVRFLETNTTSLAVNIPENQPVATGYGPIERTGPDGIVFYPFSGQAKIPGLVPVGFAMDVEEELAAANKRIHDYIKPSPTGRRRH